MSSKCTHYYTVDVLCRCVSLYAPHHRHHAHIATASLWLLRKFCGGYFFSLTSFDCVCAGVWEWVCVHRCIGRFGFTYAIRCRLPLRSRAACSLQSQRNMQQNRGDFQMFRVISLRCMAKSCNIHIYSRSVRTFAFIYARIYTCCSSREFSAFPVIRLIQRTENISSISNKRVAFAFTPETTD